MTSLLNIVALSALVLGLTYFGWKLYVRWRYGVLLRRCFGRQEGHESEHLGKFEDTKGRGFNNSMRILALTNRLEREIHRARLPALSAEERERRVREELCRYRG